MEKYKKLIQKGTTVKGDPCKQVIHLAGTCKEDAALVIEKLVLTSDLSVYIPVFYRIKAFREKSLLRQYVAIRLTTLDKICQWLDVDIHKEGVITKQKI